LGSVFARLLWELIILLVNWGSNPFLNSVLIIYFEANMIKDLLSIKDEAKHEHKAHEPFAKLGS
jgi:hypothetical protein